MFKKSKDKEKKVVSREPEPLVDRQIAKILGDGPLCACGNPVAPGQNSVCKEHIRIN